MRDNRTYIVYPARLCGAWRPRGVERMTLRPYNDADYRAAKAWLKAHPETRCWFDGCTAPATTIDHVPAISEHDHRRGTNCCQLKPACRPHNCGHGASIGNTARQTDADATRVNQAGRWRG